MSSLDRERTKRDTHHTYQAQLCFKYLCLCLLG